MTLALVGDVPREHDDAIFGAVEFRVDVRRDARGVRVTPVGEVDAATIGCLRESFDEATAIGVGRLVLDLRETTFLDSTGLHFAVDLDAWARTNRTEFAIVAGPPAVQRTFEVSRLVDRLPFVEVPRAR
jgi:anti-anti-sigma factor